MKHDEVLQSYVIHTAGSTDLLQKEASGWSGGSDEQVSSEQVSSYLLRNALGMRYGSSLVVSVSCGYFV